MAEVKQIQRKFKIKRGMKEILLPDPNPQFSIDEVQKFYASRYPEITTSVIGAPKIEKDVAVYTATHTPGTKG